MKESKFGKLSYRNFALRWREIGALKKEKVTLVLSPHLDDIFLSLHATMISGKLGKNIIGVTFFNSTNSSMEADTRTDFASLARISVVRIGEELRFSRFLASQGIAYLPVFLGLKDAALDRYYKFIAGGAIGTLNEGGVKKAATHFYSRMVAQEVRKLNAKSALIPLLSQFGQSIKNILAPMCVGSHIDHAIVRNVAMELGGKARFGLYAEIPYVYTTDSMSIESLRRKAPREFSEPMVTKFNPIDKDRLLKTLYPSQYEKRRHDAIFAAGKEFGEVILWRERV
ncbi:MAG: PIG-L family deacetylase [Candidatus Micrarchaeales archaeon]|jgi:LmbE family N-acetylglucosaminyl deacetylase